MSASVAGPNPTNRVVLKINGQQLNSWTKVHIKLGLKAISFSFELEYLDQGREQEALVYYQTNAASFAPLKTGAAIQLLIDGEILLNGWLEKVKLKQTATELHAAASGRDICGDLVECMPLPNGPADFKNINLFQLSQLVCAPFKIGVIQQTNIGAAFPKFSISPHEKAMPILEKAARQRAVLIVSDGVKNLLLTTAGTSPAPDQIAVGYNVIETEFEDDHSRRFSDVYVKGQTARANGNHASVPAPITPATAPGSAALPEGATAKESAGIIMTGHATDPLITRYRPDVRMVKTQAGSSTVQEQAEWHVRVDRGLSTKITYKVLDWRAGQQNALWRPNQLATVYDPFAEIDGALLIEEVEIIYDEENGAHTILHVAPQTAYERINEPGRSQPRHKQKKAA